MKTGRLRHITRAAGLMSLTVLLITLQGSPLHAIKLGDILKTGGIAFVVKELGPEINKAINTLLRNRKVEVRDATRVVPIISGGKGTYVGAAQVTGPEEQVKKVQFVAQVEVEFEKVRLKALIPISTGRDTKTEALEASRVAGVGVSALIDLRPARL
ncbi:MAG: hypothetical protein V2G42_06090 [bacterium JZ-2024 1]